MSKRKPVATATFEKALAFLRKPSARLIRLNANNGTAGYYLWPDGGRVSDQIAQMLLERNDIQPYDSGLLPGHPQSWKLGNWRERIPTLGPQKIKSAYAQTLIKPQGGAQS